MAVEDRVSGVTVLVGVVGVAVGSAVIVTATTASQLLPGPDIHVVPFPIRGPSVPAFALDGATPPRTLRRWIAGLVRASVYALGLAVYYLGVLGVLAGLGLVVKGVRQRQESTPAELARRVLREPWFPWLVGAFALVWMLLLAPPLLALAVELAVALGAGGAVFALAGGLSLVLSRRTGPAARVLAVYPLGMAALVLSPVAAGLASSAVGAPLRAVSADIAVWLLGDLLAVVGLDVLPRGGFELDGPGAFVVWAGVNLVTGWLVGVAVLARRRGVPGST